MEKIIETYNFKEFINYIDGAIDTTYPAKTEVYDSDFCNTSWGEAKRLVKNGITEQRNIEKIFISMNMLDKVKTKGYKLSEHGLCLDIGTYLQGEPECWISETFNYKPKKVVKLLINIGYPYYINKEQVYNRGASIMSLINLLRKKGYIVKPNLYSASLSSSYNANNEYTLFLKVPINPLNIQILSYALCHTSMHRRFVFGWLQLNFKKYNDNSTNSGNGTPISIKEKAISKDLIHFSGLREEACDYIDKKESMDYIINIFNDFLDLNNDKDKIVTN